MFFDDTTADEARQWQRALREAAERWQARGPAVADTVRLVNALDAAAEVLSRPFDPPSWLPRHGAELSDPGACDEARRWSARLESAARSAREERVAETLGGVARMLAVRPQAGL